MSFLTLDLNLLRVFDAVMSEQNLTRAASRLAMTQPAVSNALKRLRDAIGDELLIRTAHGVRPTPRAEELWPIVRNALADLESAVTPENFDLSKTTTTFRMAMADAPAALWLPMLIQDIHRDAPNISVRMMPLTTRDPRAILLHGDIDLTLGFFPGVVSQLATESSSSIKHERLYTGKYVCVMRKGHPLAEKELTIDAYCAAEHLLVSFSGRAHGLVNDALAQIGRKRRILLTVNQFYTGGSVVANSDLMTVLPKHLIASTGRRDELIFKELPFDMPPVHVDMLWHERDSRNPAHRWLRTRLAEATERAMGSGLLDL